MRRTSGRYELVSRLASGQDADVHLARLAPGQPGATPDDCAFAVKLYHPEAVGAPGFLELIRKERAGVLAFEHPVAVRTLEVSELSLPPPGSAPARVGRLSPGEEPRPADLLVAMELVEGQPLSSLLHRAALERRAISESLLLWITIEVARALYVAHQTPWADGEQSGMAHFNLSPSCILLTYDGRVRLLGLGTGRSHLLLPPTQARLAYRAPELIEGTGSDRRADIYSLGVITYDALAGRRAFKRRTLDDTRAAVLEHFVEPIGDCHPGITASLTAVVQAMMARQRSDRPKSFGEIIPVLEAELQFPEPALSGDLALLLGALFREEARAQRKIVDALLRARPRAGSSSGPSVPAEPVRVPQSSPRISLVPVEAARPASSPRQAPLLGAGLVGAEGDALPPLPDLPEDGPPVGDESGPAAEGEGDPAGARPPPAEEVAQDRGDVELDGSSEDQVVLAPPVDFIGATGDIGADGPLRDGGADEFVVLNDELANFLTPDRPDRAGRAGRPGRHGAGTAAPESSAIARGTVPAQRGAPGAASAPAAPTGARDDLAPGEIINGKYRVLARIGEGGMGVIYRVEHVLMRKELALKLLRAEISQIPQIARRFEREARAACQLDHPNIVRVTDFGREPNGMLFLVMELLQGESLLDRLATGALLNVEDSLDIMEQILSALHHAHLNEIVHRDLKPDNIMLVRREGRTVVKILDFGVAKMAESRAERDVPPLTQTGMIFGTPQYMSPEQASGETVDGRADLYTVGVMLYQMLTKRLPFDGEDTRAILARQITQPPPPLALQLADVDLEAGLERVLERALAKDRAARYQKPFEFRDALAVLRARPSARTSWTVPVYHPDAPSPSAAPSPTLTGPAQQPSVPLHPSQAHTLAGDLHLPETSSVPIGRAGEHMVPTLVVGATRSKTGA